MVHLAEKLDHQVVEMRPPIDAARVSQVGRHPGGSRRRDVELGPVPDLQVARGQTPPAFLPQCRGLAGAVDLAPDRERALHPGDARQLGIGGMSSLQGQDVPLQVLRGPGRSPEAPPEGRSLAPVEKSPVPCIIPVAHGLEHFAADPADPGNVILGEFAGGDAVGLEDDLGMGPARNPSYLVERDMSCPQADLEKDGSAACPFRPTKQASHPDRLNDGKAVSDRPGSRVLLFGDLPSV